MKNKSLIFKIVIGVIIVLVIVAIIFGVRYFFKRSESNFITNVVNYNNIKLSNEDGNDMLFNYDRKILKTYDEYSEFIKKFKIEDKLKKSDFDNNSYIISALLLSSCGEKINGFNVEVKDDKTIELKVNYIAVCEECDDYYETNLIPIPKSQDDYEVNYNFIAENETDCGESDY